MKPSKSQMKIPKYKTSIETQRKIDDSNKRLVQKQEALKKEQEKLDKILLGNDLEREKLEKKQNAAAMELLSWVVDNKAVGFSEAKYKQILKACFRDDEEKLKLLGYYLIEEGNNLSQKNNPIEKAVGL